MYARKASELIKELASGQPGQLGTFNNDLFAQVLEECNGHLHQLQPLMRKIQEHENKLKDISRENEMENSEDDRGDSQAEKTVIQGAIKSDQFGALVHHLSLIRNKRCLMAYIYNRAEVITNLRWVVDGDLPEEIVKRLSNSEEEYCKKHDESLKLYIAELDLDVRLDMIPPKDPYIKVRVLDDIGKVVLGDQVAILARHAIMFLRRTDAEQYITKGQMEELTS
ncbi:uncharacterized protein [Henckelia pumila]|uniref:uncharacterized protein n=1 Tax=Henckelia pumila TaxID=405737 RepID=UPI003C6DDF71